MVSRFMESLSCLISECKVRARFEFGLFLPTDEDLKIFVKSSDLFIYLFV